METHRLVIESAQNGFLVYINEDFNVGGLRPLPYVFESIESLQEFIKLKFKDSQKSMLENLKYIHRRTI